MISPLIIVIKKFTSNTYPFFTFKKSNTIKSKKPSKQLICSNCFEDYNKHSYEKQSNFFNNLIE